MERAGDIAVPLVVHAFERALFFAERQIDLLEDKVRSMEVTVSHFAKSDYSVKSALHALRRPLKFGDLVQIEAARFLESTGLEFTWEDFLPVERKEAGSESGDAHKATG